MCHILRLLKVETVLRGGRYASLEGCISQGRVELFELLTHHTHMCVPLITLW